MSTYRQDPYWTTARFVGECAESASRDFDSMRRDLAAIPVIHARDGSTMTILGAYSRACTCGATFTGTSESSFEQREAHIAEALASGDGPVNACDCRSCRDAFGAP